jgi:hypothetical protein
VRAPTIERRDSNVCCGNLEVEVRAGRRVASRELVGGLARQRLAA